MYLFERASHDAGPRNVLLLKFLPIKRSKELASSFTRKTLKKWRSEYKSAFQDDNNNASFKKWSFIAPGIFNAFSNKKQDLILYSTVAEFS